MNHLVKYDEQTVREDADKFLKARQFICELKKVSGRISFQQYKTLRGQALAGDIAGAEKGLAKLMGWRI